MALSPMQFALMMTLAQFGGIFITAMMMTSGQSFARSLGAGCFWMAFIMLTPMLLGYR